MSSLPVRLADTMKQFGVHVAYGEEREVEGTTLLPVALVTFGFGAGGDDEDNGGGGGGGSVIPVGAYVGDSLGVRFQPNPVALAAVAIPLVWVSGKALARIVKALKR
ncbi:spore germination protein GerW family protein [Amnibacterium sp.]|uniref:spore germination protein GerW family protein n=1 Tax=Amnibacterium sp. TaxID=1872496 RepID=UPI003F7CB448